MTDPYIPQISELNPEMDDYHSRLDDGIRALRSAHEQISEQARLFAENKGDDFALYLRERGFNPEVEELFHIGDEDFLVKAVEVDVEKRDGEFWQALIDYEGEKGSELARIRALNSELEEACEDYLAAALKMTLSRPLGELNPDYSSVHVFFLRPEKVYEGHLGEDGKTMTYESPRLRSDHFTEKFIENLGEKLGELKTNFLLVINPVLELPFELQAEYVLDTEIEALLAK